MKQIVDLLYYPKGNYFVREGGHWVEDIFSLVTPNDIWLFKNQECYGEPYTIETHDCEVNIYTQFDYDCNCIFCANYDSCHGDLDDDCDNPILCRGDLSEDEYINIVRNCG